MSEAKLLREVLLLLYIPDFMIWNGGKPEAYNHPKNIKANDINNTGDVKLKVPL